MKILGKFIEYIFHFLVNFTLHFLLNFVNYPTAILVFIKIVIKRVLKFEIYKVAYEIADSLLISNIEFCDISVSSSSSSISISKMSIFFRLSERTEATYITNILLRLLILLEIF